MQTNNAPTASPSPTAQSEATQATQTLQSSPTPIPPLTKAFADTFSAFLILSAFVIVLLAQIVMALKKDWSANAVRIVGISTIAFVGVFAALTVSNEKNGPAVFGLLGTIAGYLLGKSDSTAPKRVNGGTMTKVEEKETNRR